MEISEFRHKCRHYWTLRALLRPVHIKDADYDNDKDIVLQIILNIKEQQSTSQL